MPKSGDRVPVNSDRIGQMKETKDLTRKRKDVKVRDKGSGTGQSELTIIISDWKIR